MGKTNYGYKQKSGGKAKFFIIGAAVLVVAGAAGIGALALHYAEEDRNAAIRYELNGSYKSAMSLADFYDPNGDFDNDGVANNKEDENSTDFNRRDSDCDGLNDGEEKERGTDPLMSDSDGDGLDDGIEVMAGLDPKSTKTDSIHADAERAFTLEKRFDGGRLSLAGSAGIYGVTVDRLSLYSVTSNPGVISAAYEFYGALPFNTASVELKVDSELVDALGTNTDEISVYRFNPTSKDYTKLNSTYNKQSGTISADIDSYGVYVVGIPRVINEVVPLNVQILIDNSGSMYPDEVLSGSEENDVDFKRVDFALGLIDKLDSSANIGISKFTYSYEELCDFTNMKEKLKVVCNSIRTAEQDFDGTGVERALTLALKEFDDSTLRERNLIVILTDGISTDTIGYSADAIIEKANKRNVSIMTVSLGSNIDRDLLKRLAEETGGKYYSASEANALEGLCSSIITTMSYDLVDEDNDGSAESYSIYDTGFRPSSNGFSFANFKTTQSSTMDYAMSCFARDYYLGKLAQAAQLPENAAGESYDVLGYNLGGTALWEAYSAHKPLGETGCSVFENAYLTPENYLNFDAAGTVLSVKDEVRAAAAASGWGTRLEPYASDYAKWTQVQYFAVDLRGNAAALSAKYGADDMRMLEAIAYYNNLRGSREEFTLDTEEEFTLDTEEEFTSVKQSVSTGIPVVMTMTWKGVNGKICSHAVNLIGLERDITNPNVWKLKIYDSNGVGLTDTVTLTRTIKAIGGDKVPYNYTAQWGSVKVALAFTL